VNTPERARGVCLQLAALAALVLASAALGCRKPPVEPLQLDGSRLFVLNDSANQWQDVEIWINQIYRATMPSIAAHQRFEVPLSSFVSGYSQRFNYQHMQLNSLKLTAKQPDGTRVELIKHLEEAGLSKYFKGSE
jgi:hypothetical protein